MSVSILSWYGIARPEEAIEESLEGLTEDKGFLPHTSELLAGTRPD